VDDARYDAFISYSHAADGRLAPALQAGLQRLARPWFKPRALRVFRDDTGLAVNPHLWDSIAAALASSGHFIVLLSPEAAASPWVNREIEHWTATKDPMHILPVLTDGTLVWSGDDYDPEVSTALPPALQGRFREEPRHLDLRWARDEAQLDLRNSRFRGAVADLAAPLHGIPKDELESEDVHQHRRARRLARAAVVGLAVLLIASLVAGALAVVNARDADREARRAEREATVATARRLAAEAVARAGTAPDQALLLALEAGRLQESAESRGALLTVLQRTDRLERLVTGFRPGEVVAGLSADGATMALAGEGGGVRLLDTTTREESVSFETEQQGPVRVFFATDGETVATTSDDHTVRVWSGGEPVGPVLRGHDYALRSADFSPDGARLVTVDDYGLSALWDVRTGHVVTRFDELDVRSTLTVDFRPDGRAIAISGLGTTVFDTTTGAPVLEVPNHALVPDAAVAFSPDGTLLALDDEASNTVELWDLGTGAVAQSVDSDLGTVRSLAFSPDGSVLARGMEDGSVLLWDVVDRRPLGPALAGHGGAVSRLAFTGDGTTLVTASSSGVGRWDVGPDGLSLGRRYAVGSLPLDGVDVSPDGDVIATIDFTGSITFLDAAELRPLGPPVPTGNPVAAGGLPRLAFSPDGRFLAVAVGPALHRIDPQRRSATHEPLVLDHEAPVHVRVAPAGDVLVLGALSGDVTVVDVDRWEAVRSHDHPDFGLYFGFDLSPDGATAAGGGGDGRVFLDGVAEQGSRQLTTGPGPVSGIDYSPDGTTIAVGFGDGTVALVDAADGRRRGPLLSGHSGDIVGVRFSPDGRLLAVAEEGGRAVLWDVEGQQRIGELVGHVRPGELSGLNDLAFLPDGRALVTVGSDGTVVRWDLDPGHWAERACSVAGRNLTRSEWGQFLEDRPYRRSCPEWEAGR
jgi:WD40 repeat protein